VVERCEKVTTPFSPCHSLPYKKDILIYLASKVKELIFKLLKLKYDIRK
jgi:hypothetical protein